MADRARAGLAGVLIAGMLAPAAYAAGAPESAQGDDLEIIVTAERRDERLLDVPLSLTTFGAEEIAARGLLDIEDIATAVPNLDFARSASLGDNNAANISIRGVFSDRGAGTTAIYIDETPIQIRAIAYREGNIYPLAFDLDRIEVLRGPQGTLFGAGALGGAVRFITPSPNFAESELSLRAEASTTRHGGVSHELGFAGGTPVGQNASARASLFLREDGGWIDRVDPASGQKRDEDVNTRSAEAARLAIAVKPTARLTVTPSIYHQNVESGGRNIFWNELSDGTDYRSGLTNREPWRDEFSLYAVRLDYAGDRISVFTNTSFFNRSLRQQVDYINYLSTLRSGSPFGAYANKDPSNATAFQTIEQETFTQEVRVSSADRGGRLAWLSGLYFAVSDQTSTNLSESGRIPGSLSLGRPQYLGRYNLFQDVNGRDEELALYGDLDLTIAPRWTVTAGLRATKARFGFNEVTDGPVNGGVRTEHESEHEATSVTPRLVLSYRPDAGRHFYLSAAQGFRLGGGQSPVDPFFCAADLAALGLTQTPRAYDEDSLWSYEIGGKARLFSGALALDVNAYRIEWDNIQQSVLLPTCQFSYVDNLGQASGEGVEFAFSLHLGPQVELGGDVAYGALSFDDDIGDRLGNLFRGAGDPVGGPQWTGSVYLRVEQDLGDGLTGFARLDYAFQGEGPAQNPRAFSYDANLPRLGAAESVNLRAGLGFGATDLSVFVDNLTASTDRLAIGHDAAWDDTLYYADAFRPRTVGLTLTYRR